MTENGTITAERLLELAKTAEHKQAQVHALYMEANAYEGRQGHDGEVIYSIEDGIKRGRLRAEAKQLEAEASGLARTAVKEGAPLDEHMLLDEKTYFVLWKRHNEGEMAGNTYRFVFEDLPRPY